MSHQQKPIPKDQLRSDSPSRREIALEILMRFQRFTWDVGGIFLLAISLMTLLALSGLTGGVLLGPWASFLKLWMGYGSIYLVLLTASLGIMMVRQRLANLPRISWGKVLALETSAFATLALLSIIQGSSVERAEAGLDGGLIGWGLAEFTSLILGPFWNGFFLAIIFVLGLIIGFGQTAHLRKWIVSLLEGKSHQTSKRSILEESNAVSVAPVESNASADASKKGSKGKRSRKISLPPQFRKNFRVSLEKREKAATPPSRDKDLPPLTLLQEGRATKPNERNINLTAGLIEKTLAEFGIPAKVVGFQVGPTVTQFAVEPGYIEKGGESDEDNNRKKIRVAQIASLSRDLALALSAERLRIEAPVPGRSFVGIEVPNTDSTQVRLRSILESDAFYRLKSPLALALGMDVSGTPVVADLAQMPHLLIAGTTGSGKSVCITALTTCLAINNAPEDLRLVMIDPKKVELVRFNGLPHLFGKVETDLERILGVLRWVVSEMDRRYRLLEKHHSRNIGTFNNKMRRRKNPPESPIPHIVVMIDELADLMMIAPDQTEPTIVRLAQLARATGIHLVLATQRPSTDVVTGLIKANFPARLAFAVASSVDSRVILDTAGAETLLGSGDMLFLHPEAAGPIRAQGAIVHDRELEKVIRFWRKQVDHQGNDEPPWEDMLEEEALLSQKDDLIEEAIEIVQATQRASASMLQRRLRIGYPRAARLIDQLEDLGIVGPSQGSGKEREVIANFDEED